MTHQVKIALAAAALAALPLASAFSAPGGSNAAAVGDVQQVQYREDRGGYYDAPTYSPGRRYGNGGDNVGSIARDRRSPYGYNRFSGQAYQECMIDEGYGRVRPCSGSSRP